jgi:hypothetical protein
MNRLYRMIREFIQWLAIATRSIWAPFYARWEHRRTGCDVVFVHDMAFFF